MPKNELEQYYRARAAEYEQIYYRDHPGRRAELRDQGNRLRRLVSGKTVLELACGTGYWTEVMSHAAGSIRAVDLSEEMLTQAATKDYGCKVSLESADMFSHDFGPEKYDVVALGFWFSHQPRQEYDHLFDLLVAPLKADGLIWMVDNNPPAEGPSPNLSGTDEYGNSYKKRYLSNGREFEIMKNYFDPDSLRECFVERFDIQSLDFGEYYWSVVLSVRKG